MILCMSSYEPKTGGRSSHENAQPPPLTLVRLHALHPCRHNSMVAFCTVIWIALTVILLTATLSPTSIDRTPCNLFTTYIFRDCSEASCRPLFHVSVSGFVSVRFQYTFKNVSGNENKDRSRSFLRVHLSSIVTTICYKTSPTNKQILVCFYLHKYVLSPITHTIQLSIILTY